MRKTSKHDKVTISVVGAGNRASAYLEMMARHYENLYEVVAIFDPDKKTQQRYKDRYQLNDNQLFNGLDEFIKMERISDVVIIATLDDLHLEPTIAALDKGYDIILEKPISLNLLETIQIGEHGKKYPNQLVAVCHVLRHSPFFRKIKEIIDSKVLGNVINIQHNENIGYYHFVHSYVRGNWRNTKTSAPIIVAKSCHDMDIMLYLLGNKHAKRMSSMGDLTYFTNKNYDASKMAPRCQDCQIEKDCPFSALKIYSSGKMRSVVFDSSSEERLKEELKDSIYGRCVFNSDNDVMDHQVSIIEFEDGIHATFNMSAFTNQIHRSIKIMCEKGEIRGIETLREIEVAPFGKEAYRYVLDKPIGGHGGADEGFVKSFMETYLYDKPFDSTLEMSIESHVMAFAAEESRKNHGESIDLMAYHDSFVSKLKGE
jgi:predicted dehydrogenase